MRNLILVEDDEDVRRGVSRLLRADGYVVTAFASAEDYLESESVGDCAIIDFGLPGISGLQLYEQLRALNLRIPAVFISAHDDRSVLVAIQRTRQPLVRKPIDADELLKAIARAIDRLAEDTHSP